MAVDDFSDYPDTGASGSQEYTSPQDPSIEFTSKNPRGDYEPPQPNFDYGVGATGSVSSAGRQSSGGGSAVAPFIHPFKLERVLDPDDPNSTKVRIYEGNVYAKIDTFQLEVIKITTGASHTHSAGTYEIPEHTHNLTGQTASGSDGAHTHGGVTDSGGAGSGSEGVHQHGISSNMTGGAHQHDLSTLDTAGIVNKSSNDSVTGTSGTNSNSAQTHKVVSVLGQVFQNNPPASADVSAVFNKTILLDDGSNSIFKYHESSHSTGDFYIKWVVTITATATVDSVVGSIVRVAVGAGAPADTPFDDLTKTNGAQYYLDRTNLTGTFHQKIGSVSSSFVNQVQFSNINWSTTVLPKVDNVA
jgi:hypothetical protein